MRTGVAALSNLEKLFLDDNVISTINGSALDAVTFLRVLTLRRNLLTQLETGIFRSLVRLTVRAHRRRRGGKCERDTEKRHNGEMDNPTDEFPDR